MVIEFELSTAHCLASITPEREWGFGIGRQEIPLLRLRQPNRHPRTRMPSSPRRPPPQRLHKRLKRRHIRQRHPAVIPMLDRILPRHQFTHCRTRPRAMLPRLRLQDRPPQRRLPLGRQPVTPFPFPIGIQRAQHGHPFDLRDPQPQNRRPQTC